MTLPAGEATSLIVLSQSAKAELATPSVIARPSAAAVSVRIVFPFWSPRPPRRGEFMLRVPLLVAMVQGARSRRLSTSLRRHTADPASTCAGRRAALVGHASSALRPPMQASVLARLHRSRRCRALSSALYLRTFNFMVDDMRTSLAFSLYTPQDRAVNWQMPRIACG